MSIRKMAMIAMMACILTVCSWLTVPAPVPFTMQTFAVFCGLLLLGGRSGLAAVALYVIMGCVGLPVFSGFQGGVGHIVGPTGGFIFGFIFTAVFYLLFEPVFAKAGKLRLPVLTGGMMICYLVGTVWFRVVMETRGTSYAFGAAFSICVLPYIVPDLAKLALAWFVANRLRKAVPDL